MVPVLNLSRLPLREVDRALGRVLQITTNEKAAARFHVVGEELRVLEAVKERGDAVDWMVSLVIVGDAIATWPEAIKRGCHLWLVLKFQRLGCVFQRCL